MVSKKGNSQAQPSTNALLKKYRWPIGIVVLLVIILLYDLSPFGGSISFYAKWVQCGQKPVESGHQWRFGGGNPPYYQTSPTFNLIRLSPKYFCTPLEAEQAGYSASPSSYEFPNLHK